MRRLRICASICASGSIALDDSEQSEQVGQGVFEGAIEREDLAGDLLAPRARIVVAARSRSSSAAESITGRYADALPCETEKVSSTIQPDCETALNSKNRRDLPTPASAIAATICP